MTVYAYPPPVLPRPPLPDAMKRSARRAGGIGFVLMSAGWNLFAAAALVGILWGSLSAIFSAIADRDPRVARGFAEYTRFLDTLPVGLIVALLVVAGIVGAVLWAVGLLTSHRILRRSGHPHPWGVTWAGLGLGILASWIFGGIAQFVAQLFSSLLALPFTSGSGSGSDVGGAIGASIAGGAVWLVLALAFHIAAGVLLWWAMAAAMRPAAPTGAVPPSPVG